MFSEKEGKEVDSPLLQSTTRNLSDKLYEKRKMGALEVEQLVKELNVAKDHEKIKQVISHLVRNFSDSSQGNSRKGGLIALAATAIGLGSETEKYIKELVPPVLKCFIDQDHRVRYYACESLYNIAKVARGHILIYFNEVFDALCKLAADSDINVKNGAQLLDRLIKDIVTENRGFDIERFIPLLQERVYVINPHCRRFLIAWVMVLDSVPDIDLLHYLPKFVDGLFNMLKDTNKDIRQEAETCLAEFLREINESTLAKKPVDFDFAGVTKSLIGHCGSKDEFTRLTSIDWINEFILIGQDKLIPFSASLVGAILPNISHQVKDIKQSALRANQSLLNLITTTKQTFKIDEFLNTITEQFQNPFVPTRLAALNWIFVLRNTIPNQLISLVDSLFPPLLKLLTDPSEEVVRLALEVMAKLALLDEEFFRKLMISLLDLFSKDRSLLENRATLSITQLSLFIDPNKIYLSLALILQSRTDFEFCTVMIQTLNLILLTSTELTDVRAALKSLKSKNNQNSVLLFTTLYKSWSHNPTATLSLCLVSQLYEHATTLLFKFADSVDITVSFLLEMDKLVQLLESHIFLSLRLQLLEPEKYPALLKVMYGILMLLPQSSAFQTLRNRLNSVSPLGILNLIPKQAEVAPESGLGINFDELIKHFQQIQAQHSQHRRKLYVDSRTLENK